MATGTLVNIWAIGVVLYLTFTAFSIFFNFLWKGGGLSRTLGLVLSVISWLMGITPAYYVWTYDNQTQIYTSAYLVPQSGTSVNGLSDAGLWYYAIFIFGTFLILTACLNMMKYYMDHRKARSEEEQEELE